MLLKLLAFKFLCELLKVITIEGLAIWKKSCFPWVNSRDMFTSIHQEHFEPKTWYCKIINGILDVML